MRQTQPNANPTRQQLRSSTLWIKKDPESIHNSQGHPPVFSLNSSIGIPSLTNSEEDLTRRGVALKENPKIGPIWAHHSICPTPAMKFFILELKGSLAISRPNFFKSLPHFMNWQMIKAQLILSEVPDNFLSLLQVLRKNNTVSRTNLVTHHQLPIGLLFGR